MVEGQGQGHGNGQGHIRRGFRTLCDVAVGGGRGSHSDSRSLTVRGIYFDQTFISPYIIFYRDIASSALLYSYLFQKVLLWGKIVRPQYFFFVFLPNYL